jgi:uncharacterized protein (TIGR00297 family)
MAPDSTLPTWTKAIPRRRDRLQSRILVWIAVPILCYLSISTFRWVAPYSGRFLAMEGRYDDQLTMAVAISIFFALAAWRLKAATPLAAVCGSMICFLITSFSVGSLGSSTLRSGLTPLILLFILTFEATRLGREQKASAGIAESRKGRNAAQIIANLGVAGFLSSPSGMYLIVYAASFRREWTGDVTAYYAQILLPMLSALVEATADTVSSEIGQAFGGTPFMLTTLRRVPPGTDGAITLLGTFAGIAGAAIIAATGAPALGMSPAMCAVAFAAGVAGLFFDSLLGATVERKGWLGNDLVNFLSTAFAATISLIAIRFAQDILPIWPRSQHY